MGTSPCLREHHFPNVYRHRSGGLIFFARGKKLTAKESLLAPRHAGDPAAGVLPIRVGYWDTNIGILWGE